jgi:cadmium resistance protein CadD (predicted permease)
VDPERQPPRTPNFKVFLLVGAFVGFLVGVAVALFGPEAGNYTTNTAIGYLGVLGAVIGLGGGGVVALVVDFVNHRSGPRA